MLLSKTLPELCIKSNYVNKEYIKSSKKEILNSKKNNIFRKPWNLSYDWFSLSEWKKRLNGLDKLIPHQIKNNQKLYRFKILSSLKHSQK